MKALGNALLLGLAYLMVMLAAVFGAALVAFGLLLAASPYLLLAWIAYVCFTAMGWIT